MEPPDGYDSIANINSVLKGIPSGSSVNVRVFRPNLKADITLDILEENLRESFLRELPPSICVRRAPKDCPIDAAGIGAGDLILRINGEGFTDSFNQWDLGLWLQIAWNRLFGTPHVNELKAQSIVFGFKAGDTIDYEVLRQNRLMTFTVTLSEFGLSQTVNHRFLLIFLFMVILWYLGLKNPNFLESALHMLLWGFFILIMVNRRDVDFGFFAYLRDITAWGCLLILIYRPPQATLRLRKTYFIRSLVVATVFVWLISTWHAFTPFSVEDTSFFTVSGIRIKLFERGVIPITILWTFVFALDYLWQILRKKLAYLSPKSIQNTDLWNAACAGDLQRLVEILNVKTRAEQSGYYETRLRRLIERYNKDSDVSAVTAMRDDILTEDEEDLALSFVAVTWAETTLPILGFLGTVVGIGIAIQGIAQGVIARMEGDGVLQVMRYLKNGFEGMALAFDTTFLGLAALLIVGLFHISVKKKLAIRLEDTREVFGSVIALWATDSTVGELKKANWFRESVRNIVEQVIIEHPSPEYDPLRSIVFAPSVEFEETQAGITQQRRQFISDELKTESWSFVCLGIPQTESHCCFAAIRWEGGNDLIYYFDIANSDEHWLIHTNESFSALFPSNDCQTILALNKSNKLVIGDLLNRQKSGQKLHLIPVDEGSSYEASRVSIISLDRRCFALIGNPREERVMIHCMELYMGAKPRVLAGSSESLIWDNRLWAVHSQSATLFLAGSSSTHNRWRLQRMPMSITSKTQSTEPQNEIRTVTDCLTDIPDKIIPKQLIPLEEDKLLILDASGEVYFWHVGGRPPLILRRPRGNWRVTNENIDRSFIQAGLKGWIAVKSSQHLSMWQMRYGNILIPYDKKPSWHQPGVVFDRLMTSGDGCYLVAIDGRHERISRNENKEIYTWTFPRFVLDEK